MRFAPGLRLGGTRLLVAALVASMLAVVAGVEPAVAENPPSFVTKWGARGSGNGQFLDPAGVAVDGNGYVYVADTNNDRIQKFTATGAFVTGWGARGTGDGQLHDPEGVAADLAGNVYVSDNANDRIQKFTSTGAFLATWGDTGTGNGQLQDPEGIAVDSSGNVYVADRNNHRIQKFASTGRFVTAWGTRGTGNGQFEFPNDVAVDLTGNVYVTDGPRVQRFTSTGTFVTTWAVDEPGFGSPQGLGVDRSGNVYVTGYADSVAKYTSTGTLLTSWGGRGAGDGEFLWPSDIAFDGVGNSYVIDKGNHRVEKFAPPAAPRPVVGSLSPTSGPTTGGTQVTVTGSGFTGATTVRFGTTSTSFSVASNTRLVAVSPALPAGQVNVTVTTPAGTSLASTGSTFTALSPPRYVALGDSFSSGEGAVGADFQGRFDPATTVPGTNECHRSYDAYPYAVKAARSVPDNAFSFMACSGAQVANFVARLPRGGGWNQRGQLDSVAPAGSPDPNVSRVTLSVGGNDAGFPAILNQCIDGFLHERSEATCSNSIDTHLAAGRTLLTAGGRILLNTEKGTWRFCESGDQACAHPADPKFVVAVPSLANLYLMIHQRAPNAQIRVFGYPALFPRNAARPCVVGTFQSAGGTNHSYSLTPAEMNRLADATSTLNTTIYNQVNAARAQGVPVMFVRANTFSNHGPCDTATPWINGLMWDPGHTWLWNTSHYSFHPNALGQQELARIMISQLS